MGRVNAIKKLNSKISVNTIIFDDIQDNLHFKDFVESNKKILMYSNIKENILELWSR